MTAKTRPKRKLAIGHVVDVYNSRLQQGGALLEDMRLAEFELNGLNSRVVMYGWL